MLISGDDVIRNIPEQVAENTEDIRLLKESLPYDPTNFYNKSETDALLAEKADSSDVYTKDEVDTAISNAEKNFYVHTLSLTDENEESYRFVFVNQDPEAFSRTAGYYRDFAQYINRGVRLLKALKGADVVMGFAIYYNMPYIRVVGFTQYANSVSSFQTDYRVRIESASDTVTPLSEFGLL